MSYNLYLDDIRIPKEGNWHIVRSYNAFVGIIKIKGNPDLISFDHDLADIHYDPTSYRESFEYHEETGYDCAKWYLNYITENNLPCAQILIHSMNPVGTENIKSLFK
jgi:hypothetical protein